MRFDGISSRDDAVVEVGVDDEEAAEVSAEIVANDLRSEV